MKKLIGIPAVAIFCFTLAFGQEPQNWEKFGERAVDRLVAGDVDGSVADLTRALDLNPKFSLGYRLRGMARLGKGDADGAIADFTKMLEMESMEAAEWNVWCGMARFDKGDMKDAIANFQKVAELTDDPEGAQLASALIALAKGDADEAAAAFGKMIGASQKDPLPYYWRGRILFQRGEFEKAAVDLKAALKLNTGGRALVQPWLDKAQAKLMKP